MKKVLFFGAMMLIAVNVFAGQTVEHHNFYSRYDPSTTKVWGNDGATSTGDQVAVNTYTQKTIQVSGINVNEYVEVTIEGRSQDQINTPNWSVLDTVNFGSASDDGVKNVAVDVTEYVDFLRVGINSVESGTSHIDVEGIFTNLER